MAMSGDTFAVAAALSAAFVRTRSLALCAGDITAGICRRYKKRLTARGPLKSPNGNRVSEPLPAPFALLLQEIRHLVSPACPFDLLAYPDFPFSDGCVRLSEGLSRLFSKR